MITNGETVTLVTRDLSSGTHDADGNLIPATGSSVAVPNCGFSPGGSTELIQGQDVVIDQPVVYLPAGTPVGAFDAVIVRGVQYEVDGSPQVWISPFTGRHAGVSVKLRESTG